LSEELQDPLALGEFLVHAEAALALRLELGLELGRLLGEGLGQGAVADLAHEEVFKADSIWIARDSDASFLLTVEIDDVDLSEARAMGFFGAGLLTPMAMEPAAMMFRDGMRPGIFLVQARELGNTGINIVDTHGPSEVSVGILVDAELEQDALHTLHRVFSER
jgi:hypothetical protein